MPKIERVYDDTNAKVNPHLNPFTQLNEGGPAEVKVEQKDGQYKLPSMNQVAKLTQQNQGLPPQNLV